jgi:2',3'-cyclic-nucleotide 2'-phosphodiesterase (5'-nucleotidase family)
MVGNERPNRKRAIVCATQALFPPGQRVWIITGLTMLLFLLVMVSHPLAQDQVALTILHTNDLHAMMLPFEEEGQMVGGFSRLSTLVQQVRAEGGNVLLVDAGDTFVEDQHLMGNYFRGEPVIKVMNQMGYDLAVPGNHDFELGTGVLAQRIGEASFPYLAANIVAGEEPGSEARELISRLKPCVIVPVAGIRVAFLGLTQPLHDFAGLEIEDTVQMAEEYVPLLRQEADLVVVVTHQDIVRDYEIVDRVAGIDLLLDAHEHDIVFDGGQWRNGTLLAKTSAWGRELGRVDLILEQDGGRFRLKEAQASMLLVTAAVAGDAEVDRILEPYVHQADRYRFLVISAVVVGVLLVAAVLVLLMRRALKEA